METSGLCLLCRPFAMPGLPAVPTHCFGSGDRPAPKGVLGGFRCSCKCRELVASPTEKRV